MRTTVSLARVCGLILLAAAASVPSALGAQSLTHGALRGSVLYATEGTSIPGVQVILESADGRPLRYLESDELGRFSVPLLAPGVYRILAEQVGLQPVRLLGVTVAGGQTTAITLRLERRPPPIERVEERHYAGVIAGTSLGRSVTGREVSAGARYPAVTGLTGDLSEFDAPRDARQGLAVSGAGLGASSARLVVDGQSEALVRHPGVPGEPASAPLFSRGAMSQVQVLGLGLDTEWGGYQGATLSAYTAHGGSEVSFRPYATFSTATLGADPADNPADSTGASFQLGASLGGPIVRDTAAFMLRLDFQQIRTPSAHPWEQDETSFEGQPVSLRERLPIVAQDSFGVALASAVAPTVRTWRGFTGLGRVDWRLGNSDVFARFGYGSWTEESPLLLDERSNLNGVELTANDLSVAAGITSEFGWAANELRVGLANTRRKWSGTALPATALAAEGVAFGGSPALPASFEDRTLTLSNAFQVWVGQHRFKVGGAVALTDYEQDYRFGGAGAFTFGSLDGFARGDGVFFQTVAPSGEVANPRITEVAVFAQDSWTLSPEFTMLLGVRFSRITLPTDRVQRNARWFQLAAQPTDLLPVRPEFSPRAALIWDVQNRGQWVVRAGVGVFTGRLDPAVLSEVMLFDGGVTVRRAQGILVGWPNPPDALQAPSYGPRLTFLNQTYRTPRTFKAGVNLSRAFPGGVGLHVSGAYHHSDFLLRRTDLNRVPVSSTRTQEGRPVYGTLVQQGGLVSAAPGSNRRFREFDLVSGLSATGFSDYYEFTALLERRVAAGLSLAASYTYSTTTDNVLGALALDPADQLSPFPETPSGVDWAEGTSDYDVPHRVALSTEYRTGGRTPLVLGGRWRYRSGLPFTPGFRPGVDMNGDGAGGNDPAYLDAGLTGLTPALAAANCAGAINAFAARNTCREGAAHGLDLRLAVGLPLIATDGSRLFLTLEAFNVVSSPVGVVDRALLLVDRDGSLSPGGPGTVNVPLLVNPDFGSVLSRRNDPRLVRVGLRMEY